MRKLIFAALLLSLPVIGFAQTQSLEFYYIAHDRTTPVSDLCKILEEAYSNADRYEDCATIFYFPNYDEPIIVKMNLPGDNRQDFKDIISELRLKPAHEIYAEVDYTRIVEIINQNDFLDAEGNPTYTSVTFYWYINPDFWQFLYNEELIASLYFNLELNRYQNYVSTQIWHAAGDGLTVDAKYPFGTKNICKDMNFMLFQY